MHISDGLMAEFQLYERSDVPCFSLVICTRREGHIKVKKRDETAIQIISISTIKHKVHN